MDPVRFETHPSRYKHWKFAVDGDRATLTMQVDPEHPMKPGYELKLNSYDLSVDIELADAVQRLRFEHPKVKVVTITSEVDRCFCSGANIYMLGLSTHSFKVNFCKFTNETRLYIEDASKNSGMKFIAACNGATAGGGYELALACDDIVLVDDGSSTVSFPETPLLAVLPGTGGLTRVVDKRKVRKDRADVFCTLAEGIKGKRAVEWGLVDALLPKSKFAEGLKARADKLASEVTLERGPAVELAPLEPTFKEGLYQYKYVKLEVDRETRTGVLTVSAPSEAPPTDVKAMVAQGSDLWSLRCFRELQDCLWQLRFNEPLIGMITVRTTGKAEHVLAADKAMWDHQDNGFLREVMLLQARVLRMYDLTARSFFAVADSEDSCFAGVLFELALGADRFYMLEDEDEKVGVWLSVANGDALPTSNGLGRLALHFFHDPEKADEVLWRGKEGMIASVEADELGIPTIIADDIDFEDELRIAIEERASLSPDALTGMEASLRFPGPETMETKIFARLSAWQNWIFTRPNATGQNGALTLYGQPQRPVFNFERT